MRPATGNDDAEERADLSMYTGSSDLELVFDGNNQTIGIRWAGITIPAGATITSAWVQFTAKESQSEVTDLVIAGQAADNPLAFTSTASNISSRPRTGATVAWSPVAWTAGQVGAAQHTPELKTVIQQIVGRAGWASGNALVLIITGTGHRTATAYNGGATAAPLLHIEYTTGSPPPPPADSPPTAVLNAAQAASPNLTVNASAAGSTDSDATPIASYRFTWGDNTSATVVNAPTQTAAHTYAAAGTYTVTLTATDTGGLTSAPVTRSVTVNPPAVDSPPVASLNVAILASPARTVSASGAGSTDTDATPIASYRFTWGDNTSATVVQAPTTSATHSYAAAGTYTVTLTATDTGGLVSGAVTQSVTVTNTAPSSYTVEARPAAESDDAEESASGSVTLNSSDLELVFDGNNQIVGFRWPNLAINVGATITKAWVQFTADESQSEPTQLTLRAQAAGNATTFTSSNTNVSSRPRTTATVVWTPDPWTAGQAGAAQRTPELKTLVQEVVSLPAWAYGNAIALIVTGTGHRTAEPYQGSAISALLHVEYSGGTPPANQAPTAVLNVTQAASPPLTVNASAAGTTDSSPIASYRFTWGDNTSATVVNHPTQTAAHTYAAAGTYTVTLTATDTGGLTSAPVTKSITVSAGSSSGPPIAVWASYYSTHHSYNIQPKPTPWMGSPNVVFVGTPDSPSSGGWDSAGLRIDNLSSSSITMTVTVDIGSKRFALWGSSRTVPAGQSIIFAQTGFENFDGSDTNPAGCYDCDPKMCLTQVQSTVPVANVTIGSTTTKYYDTQQTMNTNGVDYAGCPHTSGRNDESRGWVRIYTSSPGEAPPSATNMFEGDPDNEFLGLSWLSAPFPNPVRNVLTLQFNIGKRGPVEMAVYDVAGRLVRNELSHEFEPGQYQKMIPVTGLSAGIYYCTLRTTEGTLRQTFVVAP